MGSGKDSVAILVGISALAQLGCLVRLVCTWVMSADANQMSSVLYANFLGCFAIGAVNAMKDYLDEKQLTPLFYGINAGFCGALTTFSTWMSEVARWLVWWPNPTMQAVGGDWWGLRTLSATSAVLVEVSVSCLGFQLGRSLLWDFHGFQPKSFNAQALPISAGKSERVIRHMSTCHYTHGEGADEFEDPDIAPKQRLSFTFVLCMCFAIPMVLALLGKSTELLFIMIFAPLGALLRYYLGVWYNGLSKRFCWGTFAANFIACFVFAALTIVNATHGCFKGHRWIAGLMKGIGFGFCGSLSTMSSFVAQLHEMDLFSAPGYFLASCCACLALITGILGGYLALGGVEQHVCA
mmetsp:Transcript_147429/g.282586  ORF Transcript_147429/g.282586 Transcript_147429/m.282586 type:complete len:352 (+) Transcript_147429:37-1092(+)